jgi:vacuolar-type H+-ATPase subunit H
MSPMTNNQADVDSPPAEGVTATARDEAGQLKDTSAEAARQVAESVKDKASEVTSDVREQTRRLASQTRDELVGQAGQQKARAADSLRAVGDELRGMAQHGQSGLGAQLASHGADFTSQAADFLQQHEPGELLDEVRRFARRKPGTFLLVAAAAGVVAGRLTRALAAGGTDTPGSTRSPGNSVSANGLDTPGQAVADDYLAPPPSTPMTAPPAGETSAPPPTPTPVAPDPDPGAPVTPRFGPGQVQ